MDVKYLCNQIAHLSGVPVRWYDGEELLFFSSVAPLSVDPFERCRSEVFKIEKHIGYYITSSEAYFGVVRFGSSRIVLGPTSQIPLSEQRLHDIAFRLGVKKEEMREFIAGMKQIVPLPLSSVVQYLCLINFIVNDGEELSLLDVTIIDRERKDLIRAISEEGKEGENGGDFYPHNTLDIEKYMLSLVRKGSVAELKAFFENAPAIRGGIIASSDLRQSKNLFVITATLVSRAAIEGGMDHEEALTLSDGYIRQSEQLTGVDAVTNLNYRLVMDYAERMHRLHYGKDPSDLLIDVTNYLYKHLSEPITVQEISSVLCRGRSRLSTDFKKETGENLSDYISKRKVEEAKRVLLYTDRPAVDIALYLGFSSQSHFTRVFKKFTGTTPNAYRGAARRNG